MLFGLQPGSRELAAHTGRTGQLYGIRLAELAEGAERGVRIADVRSGGGLAFTVLLDRGLDLGAAEFRGIPLAFLAPGAGFAHPAGYEPAGLGWLRSWGGGLLTGSQSACKAACNAFAEAVKFVANNPTEY